jgi:hypothetical protein
MSSSLRVFSVTVLLVTAACGGSHQPRVGAPQNAERVSPLGPSYVLVPLPNEDAGLLGRVLPSFPDAGRSLDEVSQPNPCAEHLAPPATAPSLNTFEDAEELSMDASASATLGMFGFRADAGHATHLVYKLRTERQVHQRDTAGYGPCCQAKGCGYGYIAALVYGSGEYASAEEARGSARVDMAFASGTGSVGLRVLHRRSVCGYLAAIVRITERGAEKRELGPLGVADTAVNLSTTNEQYRGMYDKEKVWVCSSGIQRTWAFCDVRGEITENEFVRRYRDTTESDELDDLEYRRSSIVAPVVLLSASTLLTTYGAYRLARGDCANAAPEDQDETCIGLISVTTIGGSGMIGGLVWLPIQASFYEGQPWDHDLREADGRYYADQYNRALLRRIVRDSQRGRQSGGLRRAPRASTGIAPRGLGFTF